MTFPDSVVEHHPGGARRLGELYWRELRRATFGVIRTTAGGDGLEIRLLGRGPALLRFGRPERAVDPNTVTLSLPDPRRPARARTGRLDLVHAGGSGRRRGDVGGRGLLAAARPAVRAGPVAAPRCAWPAVLLPSVARGPSDEDRRARRDRHRRTGARAGACAAARRAGHLAPPARSQRRSAGRTPTQPTPRRWRRRWQGSRSRTTSFTRWAAPTSSSATGSPPRPSRGRCSGRRGAPARLPRRSRRPVARALTPPAQPRRDSRGSRLRLGAGDDSARCDGGRAGQRGIRDDRRARSTACPR